VIVQKSRELGGHSHHLTRLPLSLACQYCEGRNLLNKVWGRVLHDVVPSGCGLREKRDHMKTEKEQRKSIYERSCCDLGLLKRK